MMMQSKFTTSLGLFIGLMFNANSYAQKNLTLYHMDGLPQSVYVNPSSMPKNRVYISLPIGFTNISYNNSGFKYSDLVKKDSLNRAYFNKDIGDKLNDISNLSLDIQQELLGVGFKAFGAYLHVSVINRMQSSFIYPKEFIQFLVQGNGSEFVGQRASMDGLSFNLNSYMEYGIGATKTIGQKLTVGGKLKVLSGIANFNTKNMQFGVYTDPITYDLTIDGAAEINTSNLAGLTQDSSRDQSISHLKSAAFNFKNRGIGFDLGGSFQLNDQLSVSASIIDIGSITWNNNVRNYVQEDFNFTYRGIEFASLLAKNDSTPDPVQEFRDSLTTTFKANYNADSYKTGIGTKYYLGAKYQITKKLSANFLFYSQVLKHNYIPGFTIGLTKVSKFFTSSINYTVVNKSYANVGVGICAKLGPVQAYFITDNILGLFNYQKSKYVNLSLGLSIAIKERSAAKKIIDAVLPGDQSK